MLSCVPKECVYSCMSKCVHVLVEAQGWSVSPAIALHLLHWNGPLADFRDWHFVSLGSSLLWYSCVYTFLCTEIIGEPPYPSGFFYGFWRSQFHSVFTLAWQDFTSWAIPQPENASAFFPMQLPRLFLPPLGVAMITGVGYCIWIYFFFFLFLTLHHQ